MSRKTVTATITFQVDDVELKNSIRLLQGYCAHEVSDIVRAYNLKISDVRVQDS